MENTNIEWTDHTFNPWMGCTKVSPGCDHCYAERDMDHRLKRVQWGPQGERVRTVASNWRKPLAWNAEKFWQCRCGWRGADKQLRVHPSVSVSSCPACDSVLLTPARARVFCASLADVFDNAVDPMWRADLLALIDSTPNLDWLLLTKRVGNVAGMLPPDWLEAHPNVWLGASIVNQAEADRDVPKLLKLPAAVRFLSMEPLLGPVQLVGLYNSTNLGEGQDWLDPLRGIVYDGRGDVCNVNRLDWIIVGGESGPEARPMAPQWARILRDQCEAAGVAFLFKQWGEWAPYDRGQVDAQQLAMPGALDAPMARIGKKAAGRQLDGKHYDGYPNAA